MNIVRIFQVLAVIIAATIAFALFKPAPAPVVAPVKVITHIIDQAGAIPSKDIQRFEDHLKRLMNITGIDIRFVFLPNTEGTSLAAKGPVMMDELQIGGSNGHEHGMLFLFDMDKKRFAINQGDGLEAWFPAAYVNYLANNHSRVLFDNSDFSQGLSIMLRLVQQRLYEGAMNIPFEASAIDKMEPFTHISKEIEAPSNLLQDDSEIIPIDIAPPDPMKYSSTDSPQNAYFTYLGWITDWPLITDSDLLTPESRQYFRSFKPSQSYVEFIMLAEHGRHYKIIERDDLALLYFTDTPFVAPHFFVKNYDHWYIDLKAESQNVKEQAVGEYTWTYTGLGDKYTKAFSDVLIKMNGFTRIQGGDNRPLNSTSN